MPDKLAELCQPPPYPGTDRLSHPTASYTPRTSANSEIVCTSLSGFSAASALSSNTPQLTADGGHPGGVRRLDVGGTVADVGRVLRPVSSPARQKRIGSADGLLPGASSQQTVASKYGSMPVRSKAIWVVALDFDVTSPSLTPAFVQAVEQIEDPVV